MCFNGFDPKMVWSENFHFKPFSDSRANRERERDRTQIMPWTLWLRCFLNLIKYSFDFDFESHPDRTLRLCRWTQSPDHATNPKPRSRLRLRRDHTLGSHRSHWDRTSGSHQDDIDRTEITPISLFPNVRISSSTLNKWGIARLVCTPCILARASFEVGVTSLMRKIPEACNWRLTVFVGGYTTSDGEELPQTLTLLLLMMEMIATGLGPGLLPVSLFRMMRTVITNEGVRVHLAKV